MSIQIIRSLGITLIVLGNLLFLYQAYHEDTPGSAKAISVERIASIVASAPANVPPPTPKVTAGETHLAVSPIFSKGGAGFKPPFPVKPTQGPRQKVRTYASAKPAQPTVVKQSAIRKDMSGYRSLSHGSRCKVALPPVRSSDAGDRVRRVFALIGPEIEAAAKHTRIDCKILISKIAQECGSALTRESLRVCRSKTGARGPVQMLPSTARSEFGASEAELLNLSANVLLGARYLKRQLDRTQSMPLALVAYYAGEGGAREWVKAGHRPEQHFYFQGVLSHARALGVQSVN